MVPAKPSYGKETEYISLVGLYQKEGLVGAGQAFFRYDNDTDNLYSCGTAQLIYKVILWNRQLMICMSMCPSCK